MLLTAGAALAVPDTLTLNQTEFRFPETHPGKAFVVRKLLIHDGSNSGGFGGQNLNKASAQPGAGAAAAVDTKAPQLLTRDVLGRTLGGARYQARLAQIRKKHALPLYASRSADKPVPAGRIPREMMGAGSRVALISNSPLIRGPRDLARMEKEERAALRRRIGNLNPSLARALESKGSGDLVKVVVSLATEHPGFVNASKLKEKEQKENARKWMNRRTLVQKTDLVQRYALRESAAGENAERGNAKSVVTTVSKAKILEMSRDAAIAEISAWVEPKLLTVPGAGPADFESLINSGYNPPGDMYNYNGGGVGQMEGGGLRDNFVNCIDPSLAPLTHTESSFPEEYQVHSEGVYMLAALGTPDNDRYHFRTWDFDVARDSIINYGIRSFSTSNVVFNEEYDPQARFVDQMAYVWPYPVISLPACNSGHAYVPCHRAYNALNVGNVQHYDNSHFSIDWILPYGMGTQAYEILTQSTNPAAVYGGDDDRELPHLLAPGTSPDPWWGFVHTCLLLDGGYLGQYWGPGSGTSFSAPVVNAMAANVTGANYNYNGPLRPVETRAALLVTAQNVDSGYWDPANHDGRDGAGTVSGANAVNFMSNATFVEPNNDPAIHGIGSGSMDSLSFGPVYYNYWVPEEIPEGKHLRVVLTWTSSPGTSVSENEISDISLSASTDNHWYVSDSWNGNVEMVDIPNTELSTETQYTIAVEPMTFRRASDGPDFLYYTVAWTWVKDHAE
jgi:hypothetical protein